MTSLPKQKIVVVLGMHRSGTSAITKSLELFGVDFGENLMAPNPVNPKGFWEDRDIVAINDKILSKLQVKWSDLLADSTPLLNEAFHAELEDEAIELVRSRLKNFHLWGFKDPRTCRTLPFWKRVFKKAGCEAYYIISVRNPLNVADSLAKRDALPETHSLLLWAEHTLEALNQSEGHKRIVVDYDLLLVNPLNQIQRIAKTFDFAVPNSADPKTVEYCNNFLESGLSHHNSDWNALKISKTAPIFVKNLFQQLSLVARDEATMSDPSFRKNLDAAEKVLRMPCDLVLTVNSLSRAAQRREKDLRILHNDRTDGLAKASITWKTRVADLEDNLARALSEAKRAAEESAKQVRIKTSLIKSLESKILALEKKLRSLDEDAARHALQLQLLMSSYSWRLTAPLRKFSGKIKTSKSKQKKLLKELIHRLWATAPLTPQNKDRIKRFAHRRLPKVVRLVSGDNIASKTAQGQHFKVGPFLGMIEQNNSDFIKGWLLGKPSEKGNKQCKPQIAIAIDDQQISEQSLSDPRADIDKQFRVAGSLGFTLEIPRKYLDGQARTITVTLRVESSSYVILKYKVCQKYSWASKVSERRQILLCSHNLKEQGAQYSLMELALGLKSKYALEPVIYSPTDGALRKHYEKAGIRVIMDNSFLPHRITADNWQSEIQNLANKVGNLGVSAIVANTLPSFYMVYVAKHLGLPSILIPRESEQPETYFNYLDKSIRHIALQTPQVSDKVIFVANETKKLWENIYPDKDFAVIHNSLDTARIATHEGLGRYELRASLGIKEADTIILSVGTVSPRKGQLDLIKILPDVLGSNPNAKVIILGMVDAPGTEAGEYNNHIRKTLSKLNPELLERIILIPETDALSHTNPNDFFAVADIFVFTSRIESFPRVILEAMYHGLPIVTTSCFGVLEQCIHGFNSLFYKSGDTEELNSALQKLVSSPAQRKQMAMNSRYLFSHMQSREGMLSRYYESLLALC